MNQYAENEQKILASPANGQIFQIKLEEEDFEESLWIEKLKEDQLGSQQEGKTAEKRKKDADQRQRQEEKRKTT